MYSTRLSRLRRLGRRLDRFAHDFATEAGASAGAGARLSRPARLLPPPLVESLEGRRLMSAGPTDPSSAPSPAPSPTSAPASSAPTASAPTPSGTQPSVAFTDPAAGATGVACDAFVTADLHLPVAGLDMASVNHTTVWLVDNADGSKVPAVVNTTGAGDAIILTPSAPLTPNTSYTFNVTAGVSDAAGSALAPYSSTFTTGPATAPALPAVAFNKVALPDTGGVMYSDVKVGPDHKLYASAEDGRIFRFPVNADGTLGTPDVITALQDANGGPRLVSGFAFDPASTASSVTLWVCNGYYGFDNAPDWTGKITRMSGTDLQSVQDVVTGLPRAVRDHLNEQPCFGPDGALYFCQASNSSMGAADPIWGNRPEHLLNAAVLRLDVTRVTPGQPLNAITPDGGGSYDPYAPGAPLTIYATGVRNTFDLLWSREGILYAPNNGSSAGGNTPGFSSADPLADNGARPDTGVPYAGPDVPALTAVSDTEPDFLFRITPGKYYGHPNPTRGEYVLNGGNPGPDGSGTDGSVAGGGAAPSANPDAVVPEYPAGTQPDANYAGYNYDLGLHHSPDGIIEYTGKQVFNGQLNNELLVTEYSGGSDIVALTRDADGNVTGAVRGIKGFTGFNNPISLTEDPSTGDIYVSELGTKQITLLVPAAGTPAAVTPVTPTPAPSPSPTPPPATPPTAGQSSQGGVGGASGTGSTPPPAPSPTPSPTPTAPPPPAVRPTPFDGSTLIVLTDQDRLASDRAKWDAALAADRLAVQAAESAVRDAKVSARAKARTEPQSAVLTSAARAQIAADQARLQGVLASAKAKVKADTLAFARTILTDKLRLVADRRKLRRGGRKG